LITAEQFADAWVPEYHTILGIKLRPLSLGHLILMHRVRSAFVCGGVPEYSDLAVSVMICSLTFEEGIKTLDDPNIHLAMGHWQRSVCGMRGIRYRIGLAKSKPIDLFEKSEAFNAYLKQGWSHPDYSYDASGDTVDIPFLQSVKVTLMRDLHFTETELLDRPWSRSLWDFLTLKALKGEIQMVDSSELDSLLKSAPDIEKQLREKGILRG
jgi:hypothetical protein